MTNIAQNIAQEYAVTYAAGINDSWNQVGITGKLSALGNKCEQVQHLLFGARWFLNPLFEVFVSIEDWFLATILR